MTTQLPERLRALADEAPETLTDSDLWQTGRRRHRRRVVATLVVTGCLVLATVALGVGDRRSRQAEPAGPPSTVGSQMAVPDRFFTPSPWIPATSSPGRLVAVAYATRDHLFGSDRGAVAGVVAGSQAYRFLELPGQSPAVPDWALSPDGHHLAYWINGTPSEPTDLGDRSIVGVAILDLTSGSVEREQLRTDHGLDPTMLSWVDDRTLAIGAGTYTSSRVTLENPPQTRVGLMTLGSRDPVRLDLSNVSRVPVTTTDGVYAGMVGRHILRSYPPAARPKDVLLSGPVRGVALDATSGLVAAVRGNRTGHGARASELQVGHVVDGRAHLTTVPGGGLYLGVLTWVDGTHVTATRRVGDGLVYDVVDVTTGARRELSRTPLPGFSIATDALQGAETVPGIAPPTPWNRRWLASGLLGVVLLFGGAAVLVVRRSRVRG